MLLDCSRTLNKKKDTVALDDSMVQLQSKEERNANAGSYQNYQNGALRKKTDGVGRGGCVWGEGSESVDV
jgi:hypothetical protein